jgi:RimJ/RimL family protein N-acetyltransferase/N-acetylglutamate synthase-like GNAT family acetyltransferase
MDEFIPINPQNNYDTIADDFLMQLIKNTIEYYEKIGFVVPWISYLVKDKNNYVGICSFKGKPINNSVEIAYCTHPNYESCGYATRMCKKLIEIAQKENKEMKIIAKTLPEINASTKVLVKNGFINNGIILDADDGEVFEWIYKKVDVKLEKAAIKDANEIHQMQLKAFKILLEKYEDYDTSPGNEGIDKIIYRINQKTTDYYIIKYNNTSVGAIRICNLEDEKMCRISPIFILPEFQNKGIAQNVFKIIEEKYKPQNGWKLDTILQEKGNCYLYEKLGYKGTGRVEKINEKMDIVYYEKI